MQSTLLDNNFIISSKILPKTSSDQHPISLLLKNEEDYGPIPFRFSPLWIERDRFLNTVKKAWSQFVDGSPSFVWEQKLKRTKFALKAWIKIPLFTPTSSKKVSVKELAKIQFNLENIDISHSILSKEKLAQIKSYQSFRHEEETLRLKSRSLWLIAGDKNTSFFHRQCWLRISRNQISEIISRDGVVIKGQLDLL